MADPRAMAPATGYGYELPGGWVHLDLDPARRAASARRAVAERVRREPRLSPHRAGLRALLRHAAILAADAGAERVSLFAEPVEGQIAAASMTFAVESLLGAQPLDAAQLWAGVADDPTGSLGIVELAQVAAVRRTRLDRSLAGPGGPVATRQWQLLVPWPGLPRVGLLTMSSPCPALWPALEKAFDACGQTFHWTWRGPGRAP